MSALDKVLRLASGPAPDPDASRYVRAAAEDLEQVALLLADADDDEDDQDEDDDQDDGDAKAKGGTDDDWKKAKGKKKTKGKKGWKNEKVKASREHVLVAMLALSQLDGGEAVSLSVLTAAERRKPSAHTISGSEDYPIPDEAHLTAAVIDYKRGKLAGHPKEEVRRHILSRARDLGKQVDLTADGSGTLLALAARSTEALAAMDHGAFNGRHSHPHRVTSVHDHEHYHNNDARHMCGDNSRGSDW